MGERYQTTDACELALHSCAPLRRGGENGGIGKSQHAYGLPIAGYMYMYHALMNSAAQPNCQALWRSIGSAHSLSHHRPLSPPMCMCVYVEGDRLSA